MAVILSGCGVHDGAEIHEAIMTLYSVKKNDADYEIFAPDIDQYHVINHLTGDEMKEKRNVLIEAARIARGAIKPLSEFNSKDFDAILFPGGFGVAKNLSSFAFDGADCKINSEVENAVKAMAAENKPIGALCISPAIIVKILGNVEVTIGNDKATVQHIEKMGGLHKTSVNNEITIDRENKIVTTPCYMLDATIVDIANGTEKLVKTIISLMK